MQKAEAGISALRRKLEKLEHDHNMLITRAINHEGATADLLNEARVEYTADIDGASEDKRDAWTRFFRDKLKGEVNGET